MYCSQPTERQYENVEMNKREILPVGLSYLDLLGMLLTVLYTLAALFSLAEAV